MKYKIIITLAVICLSLHTVDAQVEKTKNVRKTFPLNRNMSLKITNKYGHVMIHTWEKDSASFNISIRSADKKEADAEARLAGIDVQFLATSYYLDVQTRFPENKNVLGVDWQDVTGGVFSSSKRVDIDYEVYIPSWLPLEIVNKYGSVYASDHTGGFKLNLSNGDFKAGSLGGEVSLNLGFGNMTLASLENARMDISYAEVILKNGKNLRIASRSSKFWITRTLSLDMESKRDKFYVDTLDVLTGRSDFSLLDISNLRSSALLTSKYGDLKVSALSPALTAFNLNSEYTDIILMFPPDLSFHLTADYRKSNFSTSPAEGLNPVLVDEKLQQYKISGQSAGSTPSSIQILLNAVAGSITISRMH